MADLLARLQSALADHYAIERELRASGMATVHLAEDVRQAGDADAALDEIHRLLAGPSLLGVHMLWLDSRWDSTRNDPRFQVLLAKFTGS